MPPKFQQWHSRADSESSHSIFSRRAPIEEHMEATTIGGQWVEVLELEKVREYIHDFIYTNKIDPDETKTEG